MLMFWRGRRLALALVVGATFAAATGVVLAARVAAPPLAAAAVKIDDFAFGPKVLTVKRGTTVTWTNADGEPHTVTSAAAAPLWKSPALDTDDKFSFTFATPGTYRYFCSIHPQMQGTVVVE